LENIRNNANAMWLGFEVFETGSSMQIVKRDVTSARGTGGMPQPTYVFPKLGGTNAREANPGKTLVLKE
jgi:hypothetical protein